MKNNMCETHKIAKTKVNPLTEYRDKQYWDDVNYKMGKLLFEILPGTATIEELAILRKSWLDQLGAFIDLHQEACLKRNKNG